MEYGYYDPSTPYTYLRGKEREKDGQGKSSLGWEMVKEPNCPPLSLCSKCKWPGMKYVLSAPRPEVLRYLPSLTSITRS
jgi:hypothetical protein